MLRESGLCVLDNKNHHYKVKAEVRQTPECRMRVKGLISQHASFLSQQRVQFALTDEKHVHDSEYETPEVVDVGVEQPNDRVFFLLGFGVEPLELFECFFVQDVKS